ncbi:MAG TPA: hypothetical protein VF469_39440 [Kofleriaceae bacterium]
MWLFLLTVLVLAACGPALPPPRPLGPHETTPADVECHDERSTGTNMARSVCLTREQVEENRKAAQDWEKHPRSNPTSAQ